MMRQYKYMGINWKVNAEKDILGKMDCLLGDLNCPPCQEHFELV